MKHPEKVRRNFKKTDEEMLQQSDLKLASFVENKNLFVERFPQLADPFAAEWATATTAARCILPDYASLANQSGETDALEVLMERGRNLYQLLLLYVQIAFPCNATVLRQFGQPQYISSSKSQFKLPMLLQLAFDEASKPEYKSALIGKGISESEIASLESLAESIINQKIKQQHAKKKRSKDANNRIMVLNLVWEKMSLVCHCAKLVFQNDATRYNFFLLSDGDNNSPSPGVTPASPENNQ